MYIRDVLDTILPDTGFNRIVIYRIYRIPDSSKFKHKSLQMKAQLVKPVKYDLSSRSSPWFHQSQKPKYYPINIR